MNNRDGILYDREDDLYGGLEVDNLQEALDYYGIEEVQEFKSKQDEDLNQFIEADYHNTYYNPNTKKYGTRTLKMKNSEYLKSLEN